MDILLQSVWELWQRFWEANRQGLWPGAFLRSHVLSTGRAKMQSVSRFRCPVNSSRTMSDTLGTLNLAILLIRASLRWWSSCDTLSDWTVIWQHLTLPGSVALSGPQSNLDHCANNLLHWMSSLYFFLKISWVTRREPWLTDMPLECFCLRSMRGHDLETSNGSQGPLLTRWRKTKMDRWATWNCILIHTRWEQRETDSGRICRSLHPSRALEPEHGAKTLLMWHLKQGWTLEVGCRDAPSFRRRPSLAIGRTDLPPHRRLENGYVAFLAFAQTLWRRDSPHMGARPLRWWCWANTVHRRTIVWFLDTTKSTRELLRCTLVTYRVHRSGCLSKWWRTSDKEDFLLMWLDQDFSLQSHRLWDVAPQVKLFQHLHHRWMMPRGRSTKIWILCKALCLWNEVNLQNSRRASLCSPKNQSLTILTLPRVQMIQMLSKWSSKWLQARDQPISGIQAVISTSMQNQNWCMLIRHLDIARHLFVAGLSLRNTNLSPANFSWRQWSANSATRDTRLQKSLVNFPMPLQQSSEQGTHEPERSTRPPPCLRYKKNLPCQHLENSTLCECHIYIRCGCPTCQDKVPSMWWMSPLHAFV